MRVLQIPWQGNVTSLAHVRIVATWENAVGSQDKLRVEVDSLDEGGHYWRHKRFEGTSPLNASFAIEPGIDLGPHLELSIGMPLNGTTPIAGIALVEQQVQVAVQQVYCVTP